MDDTVVTMDNDYVYMVVNGACKDKDMAYFNQYIADHKFDVNMNYEGDQQLFALQGDGAKTALGKLAPSLDLKTMPFMFGIGGVTVAGIEDCRVTRCGYTGEDGFEIAVDPKNAVALAEALLADPTVEPCGLGARDSLRLEAGLCLYGNDLDESTNPAQVTERCLKSVQHHFRSLSTF